MTRSRAQSARSVSEAPVCAVVSVCLSVIPQRQARLNCYDVLVDYKKDKWHGSDFPGFLEFKTERKTINAGASAVENASWL